MRLDACDALAAQELASYGLKKGLHGGPVNRIDYLTCRIAQLRAQGAGAMWAQWLARLELGERPAGQAPPVSSPIAYLAPTIVAELCARRRPREQPRGSY